MKCIKNDNLKCSPNFCYTVNGSCYKYTTSGLPCTLESKRKKSNQKIIVNREYMLFGPEKEVNQHIEFLQSTRKNTSNLVKIETDTKLDVLKTPQLVTITEKLLKVMELNRR